MSMHFSIFEILMLVCFGASWPFALIKTYKTKVVKGTSRLFLSLIFIGYLCGILHKIFYLYDWVIYLYVLNALFVAADFVLYFRYRKRPENKKS